jgi:hypothetical protein
VGTPDAGDALRRPTAVRPGTPSGPLVEAEPEGLPAAAAVNGAGFQVISHEGEG